MRDVTLLFAHVIRCAVCLLALLCYASGLEAQNTVFATTNLYRIRGRTLSELRQSLTEARPWKSPAHNHDAFTSWQLKARYELASTPDGCQCASFSTVTHIAVTLPQWIRDTNATVEVVAEWSRYLRALAEHEGGHARNAREASIELHRRVKLLEPQPDCDALKANMDGLIREVQEEYRQLDVEYDKQTRHGLDQGAVFPLAPRGDGDARPGLPAGPGH